MSEQIHSSMFTDHRDALVDVVLRRQINDFAMEPVSFNALGLEKAQEHLGIGENDTVLDIGSSSGQFIIEAAQQTGTQAKIIGLEPDVSGYISWRSLLKNHNFTMLQGVGEHIPLLTSSVQVTTAHNVIFRAQNLAKMLEEIKRVTAPDGLIIISTNSRDHAPFRHLLEKKVARAVARKTLAPIAIPQTPAKGCYLEDMPRIIKKAGGLEQIDQYIQHCDAEITEKRLDTYLDSIQRAANQADTPVEYRQVWREIAEKEVTSFVMKRIRDMKSQDERQGIAREPFFADIVHRGMVVLRNSKPSVVR